MPSIIVESDKIGSGVKVFTLVKHLSHSTKASSHGKKKQEKREEEKKGQAENRKKWHRKPRTHTNGLENPGEYQGMQRYTVAEDYCVVYCLLEHCLVSG